MSQGLNQSVSLPSWNKFNVKSLTACHGDHSINVKIAILLALMAIKFNNGQPNENINWKMLCYSY